MSKSAYAVEQLHQRLARIQGSVAIIKVGGQTEVEIKHKKILVENALHSVKACLAIRPTKQSDHDKLTKAMMDLLDYQLCKKCGVAYKDRKEYCEDAEHVEYNLLKSEFLRLEAI